MTIFLVEDCDNAPGRILACFRYEGDAQGFADSLGITTAVEARTLNFKPITSQEYIP